MALRHMLATAAMILTTFAFLPGSTGTTVSTGPDRSTYLGGSDFDEGHAIDVGPDGAIYVAGQTHSPDFPGDTHLDISSSAFVAKLTPDAKGLVWSWVFGGGDFDAAHAIHVADGNVFVAGETWSADFPISGPNNFDSTHDGGADGFLTSFTTDGAMRWSSYVGGSSYDAVHDLETDDEGRPVVGGWTQSCDFPTMDTAHRGPPSGCDSFLGDAFVARFWPDGALHRTTLFGGSASETLSGLSVSPVDGSILLTGHTDSTDLPVGTAAAQSSPDDVYVARLNEEMSSVTYATYLGGDEHDWAWDVAGDASGNAFVTGYTYSGDYPTTSGAYRTTHASLTGCPDGPDTNNGPCQDIFVTKLNPTGSEVVWSTLMGGAADDEALGIAVDDHGGVHVAGSSASGNSFLPARSGERGFAEGFHATLSPDGSSLRALGALPGSDWDSVQGLALGDGRAWMTGFTWSGDFRTSDGAFDETLGGSSDAFASAFAIPTPTLPALSFDHRGGNEWWVEVKVDGGVVTAVEARDTGGPWVALTKRSWGPWAGSFHIEPGNTVQFRAMTEGAWIESCPFTHPGGVERCPGDEFQATFSNVKGNEWWIETRVVGTQTIAGVDVSLDGGPLRPLALRSWGSWAESYHAPSGTVVQFTATSTSGEAVQSGCYRWTAAAAVECGAPATAPVFDHHGGNEWWVEVVVSGPTPDRVEARDADGGYVALSFKSWGVWANSFHIEPGHDVQFRALVAGVWHESCWFTHPGGQARTGGATCEGVRVS